MSDKTEIAWTDSTFNPWVGCTKVSPGCDNCYAEKLNHRFGGNHWVEPSKTTTHQYWKQPVYWNRDTELFEVQNDRKRRVFCGSMCDVFDKNAPDGQRERLWNLIKATPHLNWQLLTKRAPNIKKYLPTDWGNGYKNVWLGVTVENQKHGKPRIDILRNIPATVRFLSVEPLLEDVGELDLDGIHWVIVGGESGPGARPMQSEWMESVREQCRNQSVPFFFKQWGPGKNKGGCLIDGVEVKEWPIVSYDTK